MKALALIAVLALTACANALVTPTGENEWVIGESGRDAWHTDSTVRSRHYARATQVCGDGRTQPFEPAKSDGLYHFRCIPPEHSRAEQIVAARAAWLTCLQGEEPPVDDLLSDGHTVAAVLATRCDAEIAELVALVGKGYPRWNLPDEALQRVRRQVALDVVLQVRAMRRNPSAPAPKISIPSIGPGDQ